MNITEQNILAHEIIGLFTKVIDSKDPTLKKLEGRIVYETRNTLVIDLKQKTKSIPKKVVKLSLRLPDGRECIIDGADLIGRPEDRINRLI